MKRDTYLIYFIVLAIFVFAGCSVGRYAKSTDEIKNRLKSAEKIIVSSPEFMRLCFVQIFDGLSANIFILGISEQSAIVSVKEKLSMKD